MTTSLREPFFLDGRTRLLNRAVVISCVLGALAAFTAWLLGVSIFFLEGAVGSPQIRYLVPIIFGTTVALVIHAPLNFWNRGSWIRIVAAIPVIAAVMSLCEWLHSDASNSRPYVISLELTLAIASGGLLQLHRTRAHFAAYGTSVILAVGAALLTVLLLARFQGNLPIPGLTQSMQRAVLYVALFGSWMAALSIPWGIPFWWPPEDRREPATPQPDPQPTTP